MHGGRDFDLDRSPRDIAILQARVANPEKPVSELRDVLEADYGISLSHNRVNEILNEMRDEGVFSMRAVPNRHLFEHYLFRVGFEYSNFDAHWEDCYDSLLEDPHVVLFASADDPREWQFVAQFATAADSEAWRREFASEHGDLIAEVDKTAFPTVHKFETAAAVFDDLLADMGAEEFVDATEDSTELDDLDWDSPEQ